MKTCVYCHKRTDDPCEYTSVAATCRSFYPEPPEKKDKKEYVLYIIPRFIKSMSVGKAMAHVAHASNAFAHKISSAYPAHAAYKSWATDVGFGTTVVLTGNDDDVLELHQKLTNNSEYGGFYCGFVHDPTYPFTVSDEIYHLLDHTKISNAKYNVSTDTWRCTRSERTACYLFAEKNSPVTKQLLATFDLHP